MSKSNLQGLDGKELVSEKKCPELIGAKPAGCLVMVELLKPQEVMRTNLHLGDDVVPTGGPQAIILALGPRVPDGYEYKIGDRVVLTGNFNLSIFTPLPDIQNESGREVFCIEPSAIKAILIEKGVSLEV
ncbi:MAG: hypothetical protein ACW99G_03155 [Candidatus Thorarchaeota archaeon]|jgi:hypothetical protein